jgi:hypothetical protein
MQRPQPYDQVAVYTGQPGSSPNKGKPKDDMEYRRANRGRDTIEVRVRGKNNEAVTKTGSVTRTLGEIDGERSRRQELAKAAGRLRMLEKLEDYREEKMAKEIEALEREREYEEDLIRLQREKEVKYA